MSIDPEELRDQIIAARKQLQHLVHQPGKQSRPFQPVAENEVWQKANPAAEAPEELQDCIEVVTWRRLHKWRCCALRVPPIYEYRLFRCGGGQSLLRWSGEPLRLG